MTELSYRETRTKELAERRAKRTSEPGPNYRLTVANELKRNDLEYRWINDDAKGNVNYKTNVDTWDFVSADEIANDPRNSANGSRVERLVGTKEDGTPLKAYLCVKPKAWHEEDRIRKNRQHEDIMKQIHTRPVPLAGEADLSADEEHAYVPTEAKLPPSKRDQLGLRRA